MRAIYLPMVCLTMLACSGGSPAERDLEGSDGSTASDVDVEVTTLVDADDGSSELALPTDTDLSDDAELGMDADQDIDVAVEPTDRVVLWGVNADHCMPGHPAYRPPALQIYDQLDFDDPSLFCCSLGAPASETYYRGRRRPCTEPAADTENYVEVRYCSDGPVEPQIAFEDGCRVFAHWTDEYTQVCSSWADSPPSTYWRREFGQQTAGQGPSYIDTPQQDDICPSFEPEVESQLPSMYFEQLERDDPTLTCCKFYGYDEEGHFYYGGRRACDEPVNPPSNRGSIRNMQSSFWSFGCTYAYSNGCPTAGVGGVFGLYPSEAMSPFCRRGDRPLVEPWP